MRIWRVLEDAGQVVQQVASLLHRGTAEDVGQAALEIAAQYVAEHALGHAIQLAQRHAITDAQINAQDANAPVRMIARQDAKQTASLRVQRIVRIHVLIVLDSVAAVVMQFAQMIALVGAKEDAIRPAHIIA